MSFWNIAQQNAGYLLVDGAFSLLKDSEDSSIESLPEQPGVVVQCFDARLFHAADTRNLRKLTRSNTDPRHSGWYKELVRNAEFDVPELRDFYLHIAEAPFGRRELAECLTMNLSSFWRRIEGDQTGHFQSRASDIWQRMMLTHRELIEEGGSQALHVDPVRWGGASWVSGPGILIVQDRHDDVIFVDSTADIPAQYIMHARRTQLSTLRQRIGERFLNMPLRPAATGGQAFTESGELEVSSFLRACRVSFFPVQIGRAEVCEDLIERLRPELNDFTGARPFERRREFHRPIHRKHRIWG